MRGVAQMADGPHQIDSSIETLISEEAELGLHQANTLQSFGDRIEEIKEELGCLLKSLKEEGKTIGGFGAPAKATTLMYHFDIGPGIIDFIVDDSQLKQGLYSPGMHIPIKKSSTIYKEKPDVMLILAWNFSKSIMNDHKEYLRRGGMFVVPLPKVEIFQL